MAQVLCPILVGRVDELAAVEDALDSARSGSGRVVFLVGEAGIGKSRLLREVESRARDIGMRTARGRAVAGGSRIPFRPVAEALQSFVRMEGVPADPLLDPYRPALGALIPEWSEADRPPASAVVVMEAVVRLLRAIAANRGIVLSLDDLHWADADTLALVEYLADNVAAEPILCACALRSDEPGHANAIVDRLVSRRVASRLDLARLTDEQTDDMIRASLRRGDTDTPLGAVRARAEGVPFLVEEMLSALVTSGTPALPASYRELVRDRLSKLDPRARRVIEAAAAIGRDFDWRALEAVTGLDRDAILGAVRAAVDAHLVTASGSTTSARFGFRHALVRDAILEELLPPERVELFVRAADALEEAFPGLPGEWVQTAADLRERAGDPTDASRLLLEIARRALNASALATAEAALDRARELTAGDRWRTMAVHRLLVRVKSLAGKTEGLREIGDAAVEFFRDKPYTVDSAQLGDLHLQIARGVTVAGDTVLARTHVERALELAAAAESAELRARTDAFSAHLALSDGERDRARALAREAHGRGERLGLPDVVSEALRAQARLAFDDGDADGAYETLGEARRAAEGADLLTERAEIHLLSAALDRSTSLDLENVAHARELAERTGSVAAQAAAEVEAARLHAERLELDDASEAAERGVDIATRYGLTLLAPALVARAIVAALRADRAEVERAVSLVLDSGDPSVQADALGEARAVLHLVLEEQAKARDALDAAIERARHAGGSRRSAGSPFAGLRSLVGSADHGGIARNGGAAATVGRASRGYDAAASAVALGRAGKADDAPRLASEAFELLAPFRWRAAHARRLVAEAAIRDGWGDPAAWLEEALGVFVAAGQERLAAASRGLLARAGVRVRRKGRGEAQVPEALRSFGITTREMDVLNLLADGLPNAEIAERLFLSVRTVETHASRLLQKTQLGSRAQLVAFANRVRNERR